MHTTESTNPKSSIKYYTHIHNTDYMFVCFFFSMAELILPVTFKNNNKHSASYLKSSQCNRNLMYIKAELSKKYIFFVKENKQPDSYTPEMIIFHT